MQDRIAAIQVQRDRFLAFAFAAADLLLELDEAGRIAYASGATMQLLCRTPDDLRGEAFLNLVAPLDRAMVAVALRRMTAGTRLQTLNVALQGGPQGVRAWVNGYRLPLAEGPAYIALSTVERFAQQPLQEGGRDPGSGLLQAEALTPALAQALESGTVGRAEDVLTLLQVEGLDALGRRLTPQAFDALLAEIGGFLRLQGGGRDLAGRLGEARFGVLHAGDGRALGAQIEAMARQADPGGSGVQVASRDVSLAMTALTPAEAARAVIHTLKAFERLGMDAPETPDLATAFHTMLNETVTRLADFRAILARNAVELVYQPIVSLADGTVHHHELLARFGDGRATAEWISFGESMGMNAELDLLVCRRAIEDLVGDYAGTPLALAVNLSGNSLQDPMFTDTLLELLRDHPQLAGRLLFEVTESAEIADLAAVNAVLQQIRQMGFRVCLDDFGAGAASFQYLQALTVDYVKIDGSYVARLAESARDRHMLAAIAAMCADLEVGVIAEMVETETQVRLLRELGATHAQGWLYGRPEASPAGIHRRRPALNARRQGIQELWTT